MIRPLVILTSSYPYGQGEPFFAAELLVLAQRFPRIILLPTSRPAGEARAVPSGVEVADDLCKDWPSNLARTLRGAWRGMRSRDVWHELRLRPADTLDPRGLARCLNFWEQSTRFASALAAFLRAHRLERAVVYSYWATPSALAACLVKRHLRDLAVASRFHGGDLYEERYQPPYLPLRQVLLDGLDRFFFISAAGLRYFGDRFPIVGAKATVMRLGVEPPAEAAVAPDVTASIRILSCSWILPVKRLNLLVEALGALARLAPETQVAWTHIGDGPDGAQLRDAAADLPASISVRFLGHLDNTQVRAFYASNPLHALINVSSSEGLPVSFMEAMSFGIPVVAPDVGGIAEIVRPESGILLAPDPAPEAIARAILRIGSESGLRSVLGAGARALCLRDFDAKLNFSALADALGTL